MHSWPSPHVPALAPSGVTPTLFNTRRGALERFHPRQPGRACLYVCGITPYDATHLGHAMTYHTADLMRRIIADAGLEVAMAQNVTDVDDPLFERAARDGVAWRDLASEQTDLFRSDMTALRILAPQHFEGVSEAMDRVSAGAQKLRERGMLYAVDVQEPGASPGAVDWYHDLAKAPGFGGHTLVGDDPAAIFAERGGDPGREGKRNPLDPLVWRAAREGEPAWDGGSLGLGRPGWHLECVVIAHHGLGGPIDLQIGGRDLVFPHHDHSHAHAVGFGWGEFARTYAHVGLVGYQGHKMSKSLGNLVFVSRLIAQGARPMAIRLALMSQHYRSSWQWNDELLAHAHERLAIYRTASAAARDDSAFIEPIREALRNDLDTARVLEILDAWSRAGGGSYVGPALDSLTGVSLA